MEKEDFIKKFDYLVDKSNNKFKEYEENNFSISNENKKLKLNLKNMDNKNKEYFEKEKNFINQIENLKEILINKDNEINSIKIINKEIQENAIKRISEIENNLREDITKKYIENKKDFLEEINKLNNEKLKIKIENEKFKSENLELNNKIKQFNIYYEESRLENEKLIDNKNLEFDNLIKNINSARNEMSNLENLSLKKEEEFKNEIYLKKNENIKLRELLEKKEEKISSKILDGEKMFNIIEDQQKAINEMEEILLMKDDSIKRIKYGGENINRNIEILEIKLRNSEERCDKIRKEYNEEINILNEDKNKLLKKIKEINEYILEKNNRIKLLEEDLNFKNNEIIIIRNKNEAFILNQKKAKIYISQSGDTYKKEINYMEKLLKEKQELINGMIMKYENKKFKVQYKILKIILFIIIY
jgi:hypothetical protein